MADATVTPPTETLGIDTSDMVSVHRVFRNSFAAAAPLVGSVAPDDVERVAQVGTFYANVLEFLRVHHEGEDALLWPRLIERAPDEADTVRRIAGQHEGIHDTLDMTVDRLTQWRADPNGDNGAQLAASLATLGAELGRHLDEEERVILPLAAVHLSAQEWGELPGHGMMHFREDKIWLILGLIREQFDDEQILHMEAEMPPPVLELWRNEWRQQFEAFVAELRG